MRTIPRLLFALLMAFPAFADDSRMRIIFKDGRIQSTQALSRSKDTLFADVADQSGASGKIGYPVAAIARLELPEPKAIASSRASLGEGRAAEALRLITPVEAAQAPLLDIEGNWWTPSALVKAEVLIALGKNAEAKGLLERLDKAGGDSEMRRQIRLRLAAISLKAGQTDEASAVFDQCIAESTRPEILAAAWKGRGDVLAARREYDPALLAYLRVPIFFSNQALEVRSAKLGAASALVALGHRQEALEQLERLSAEFPGSAEAGSARKEIERLEKNPSLGTSPTL